MRLNMIEDGDDEPKPKDNDMNYAVDDIEKKDIVEYAIGF